MRLKESWLYQGNDKWLSLISVQDMERALLDGRRLQNKHNNYTVNCFFCSGNSTSLDNGESEKRVCFFFSSHFHMTTKLIQRKENVVVLLLFQSRHFYLCKHSTKFFRILKPFAVLNENISQNAYDVLQSNNYVVMEHGWVRTKWLRVTVIGYWHIYMTMTENGCKSFVRHSIAWVIAKQ